ncbi:protein kinase [Nocardia sp. NPDC058666]|uniref:serine/threonine-protein kinase n=1 Tax=unclassified Nocardia TaxID=2637762 RepID=UPI003654B012
MHDIGEVFAGFTIEAMLGQGGMGTVYLARHPRLDRLTALKLLNRDLFADERVRARFEREADLAAGLDHPGIVTVFDRGTEGEQLWISMQYVDGIDAATVDPMALPPERAVQIIEGVADALDYAHGRGVLHRDVKPANILLARSSGGQGERVFLTDFGIARLRADSTHLTQQGMFTATLAYASPEQMTGSELDHRSDQYSLACSLYWLFTGIAPFDSVDPNEIIRGTLYGPPPPLALRRAGLPPSMDAVLAAAMAKHPAARFDSCVAFAKAARQALTSTTPPVLPRPPANPAAGYYPPAGGPAPFPQPGMAPPGYQGSPMQPAPQPNWQPPRPPAAVPPPAAPAQASAPPPVVPAAAVASPAAAPPVEVAPSGPSGDAAAMSTPPSLEKKPKSDAKTSGTAEEVSATAATDVLATPGAGDVDAANAAALTTVTSLAGPSEAAPAGIVPKLGQPGLVNQVGQQVGPPQVSGSGQPGGPLPLGTAGGPVPGGPVRGAWVGPHRGHWPVPRRVSGMRRFGWVLLVALVVVLVALAGIVVVAFLGDDDGDFESSAGAHGPSSSVVAVGDSFAGSRRVFPTLVPQGQMSDGMGYQGARCVGVRHVSELEWKETALQWSPITVGWQCRGAEGQPGAVSYLVLEYADAGQARSVAEAMPGPIRSEGDKDGVPFSLRRWVIQDPANPRTQTAHQVLSFPEDSDRANYVVVVSRRGSSGAAGAPRPTAQDDVIAWWNDVDL